MYRYFQSHLFHFYDTCDNFIFSNKYADGQHSAALVIEKPPEPVSVASYNRRPSQTETSHQTTNVREPENVNKSATASGGSWTKPLQKPASDAGMRIIDIILNAAMNRQT